MRVPGGKCGNEGRPIQGIDTSIFRYASVFSLGGNEGRPFQGIDTLYSALIVAMFIPVEMKVAPFRALTHTDPLGLKHSYFSVEMRVAPFRALTHKAVSHRRTRSCTVEMRIAPFRALTHES